MVNGIVSLISLSDLLFLVFRNALDLYALILYPASSPNSLMSSGSFLGFPGGIVVKNLPADAGDLDSIPGSG